jgi:hypothetical protein
MYPGFSRHEEDPFAPRGFDLSSQPRAHLVAPGKWTYLYRAVDSNGATIDFCCRRGPPIRRSLPNSSAPGNSAEDAGVGLFAT